MREQGAMMVVCTRPTPGREDGYNRWYDEHARIMFDYPGMDRVSRNRRDHPLGDAGENSPEYVTLYELKDRADVDDYVNSPQMDRAKVQFEESWDGLGTGLWSGFFEPVKTLQRAPLGERRFTEMVGSGPQPGREKEYLDWYFGHVTEMFAFEGIVEVSLFKLSRQRAGDGKRHDFLTVYDFADEAAMRAFYRDPIFTGAGPDWHQKGLPVVDLQWAACYASAILLQR